MKEKTQEHAVEVLKAIKAEVESDVIKSYEMPTLLEGKNVRKQVFRLY